jgi:serine/threonine-protein kinase
MGEVYRARDTRLGRPVAIKVIAADLSADPKRQVRFHREAKAISSLNHPNICTLYDVGEIPPDSTNQKPAAQYIVMEYLEGETLEERLKKGPLPLDQVFRYGVEIADALDAAHRKQILHRDLKPANIMITSTGARLFDFGLAKYLRGSTADVHGLRLRSRATTAEKPLTAEGSLTGTLEYMAPEQLEGKEPDVRTDIFSYGVCLYQMITGRRPFQGNTRASLGAAILDHDPPPISNDQPAAPPSLEWLVKNCLAKDPDERIQTAHDVKLELQRTAAETRISTPVVAVARFPARRWVYSTVVLTAMLTIAGTALIIQQTRKVTAAKDAIRRFSISLPPTAPLAEGPFEKFAVSPDGNRIVYVGGNDPTRLYLYSIDTLETKPLPGTEGARGPFFSPDGEWIGFYTVGEGLKRITVRGGIPMLLGPERDLRGATWGRDGSIVFAQVVSPLRRISASGGQSEALPLGAPTLANVRWPSFLPKGESILLTMGDFSGDYENAKLAVYSLKSRKTKSVLDGATYGRYVSSGHLLYLHSQTLFAAPFDANGLKVTGPPVSVVSDIDSYFSSGLAHFAVSSDGSIFYIPRDSAASERELVWVDRAGRLTPITAAQRAYQEAKLSPDGKRLLVAAGLPPRLDLWFYDIARDTWTRMTSEANNQSAIWSPDGKQIAFASNKSGGFDLYIMPSDGGTPAKRIAGRRSWDFPTSWSPDGKAIAVVEQYRTTFNDISVLAPTEGAIPTPFLNTAFDERDPVFSPDGHWMAYRSNESGRDEIYVQRYPAAGPKWLLSTDGGTNPVWRRDGRELFYRKGNTMMAISTGLRPTFSAGKPKVLFEGEFEDDYDVTADGSRFVMIKRHAQSPRTQINVVLGLFGERLSPPK